MPMIRVTVAKQYGIGPTPRIIPSENFVFEPRAEGNPDSPEDAQSLAVCGDAGFDNMWLVESIDEIWKKIEAIQSRPVVAIMQQPQNMNPGLFDPRNLRTSP